MAETLTNKRDFKRDLERYQPELLDCSMRGDGGQQVLKVVYEGRPVVLKRYGLKRGRIKSWIRQIGSLGLVGKSSITPRARRNTEREVLGLWRREGFDAPRLLSIPELEETAEPCLVMEWVPGPRLSQVLGDSKVPIESRTEHIRRFSRTWGERHARALSHKDASLIVENPTFDHVLVSGERLVHYDFEIVFRRTSDLERLVRRELVGFVWSMAKWSGDDFSLLLQAMLDAYPEPGRFARVVYEIRRFGTVPVLAWTVPFHCITRRKKRYASRLHLLNILEDALQSQG